MARAGDILNTLLNGLIEKNKLEEGSEYYKFVSSWEKIIGQNMVGHTKIIDLKKGTLLVAVDHRGWIQMVRMKEKAMIKLIEQTYPSLEIRAIKIIMDRNLFINEKSSDITLKKTAGNEQDSGEMDNYEEKLSEIGDRSLKTNLARLYKSIVKNKRDG